MDLEYSLRRNTIPEGRVSVYEGYEDSNVFHSIKDTFVTVLDLLKLTLRWNHWLLLIIALVAFVLAGGFFTYNFAVLKDLVEVC